VTVLSLTLDPLSFILGFFLSYLYYRWDIPLFLFDIVDARHYPLAVFLGVEPTYELIAQVYVYPLVGSGQHRNSSVQDFGATCLSYSPDMNIIEHMWALLDRRVRARTILPWNCNELWEALQEEWVKIDSEVISNYYASMPKRVQELIDNEGGSTSY
jgi:hypothetical protein